MLQPLHGLGGYRLMNNIENVFAKGKALIPFVTVGDPSLTITEKLVIAMARAGADLIELGIPFSDPVAEGIVIQKADERALAAGVTTDKIFAMVKRIREQTDVPLAFMTYMNPIFTYGKDRFFANCKACAVDAVIIPDLSFEEQHEVLPYCQMYGVNSISFIAPTSFERICMIAQEAQGFLYCVSSLGVTGVREKITTNIEEMVALAKEIKNIPCAVGFGISTPQQAKEISQYADGIIIGSAIVRIVEKYDVHCIEPVCEYIQTMKQAMAV